MAEAAVSSQACWGRRLYPTRTWSTTWQPGSIFLSYGSLISAMMGQAEDDRQPEGEVLNESCTQSSGIDIMVGRGPWLRLKKRRRASRNNKTISTISSACRRCYKQKILIVEKQYLGSLRTSIPLQRSYREKEKESRFLLPSSKVRDCIKKG
jgi:hypothetical protein